MAVLTAELEKYETHDPEFNAFIVADLVELQALEAAPVIQRAFEAEQVAEFIMGDWEDAQIELGLKAEREHPRKRFNFGWPPLPFFNAAPPESPRSIPPHIQDWNAKVEAKQAKKEETKAQKPGSKKKRRH